MQEVQVVRRRLTPAQARRRERIVAEALRLVAAQGATVSMEAVARAAQVSRATLYRYYSSREHLLAEVTLAAGQELVRQLQARPPAGRTVGKRLENFCKQLVVNAEKNERLLRACVSNLSSEDPGVVDAYHEIEKLVAQMLSSLIGTLEPDLEALVGPALFRYLFGAFVLATSGKIAYEQLAAELISFCRLLLADIWAEPIRAAR